MTDKLKKAQLRYLEIEKTLAAPSANSDFKLNAQLLREYRALEPVVTMYRKYLSVEKAVNEAAALARETDDRELKGMAEEELRTQKAALQKIAEEIKILLIPKDPNDDRNVVVEIRAGAGGEEAALFCGVLYRMYAMYAQSKKWKTEIVGANQTELGGYKEISFLIEGQGAFSRMKFESGVHRVQRVPETESQGRIQTSTVTVAVLPEAEEIDVAISEKDLQIDTHRASGAGGQHVNKTDSAIRILHKPTGIIVECQDERSQFKNREKAMKVLRSKILEQERERQNAAIAGTRKNQIGKGDRSERIRTYNYPQGRISDHRIGLTLYTLDSFVDGKIDEVIDALITADRLNNIENGDFFEN